MKKKILLPVIFLLTIFLTACGKETISDSKKFTEEYTKVPKYNVFVYRDSSEIIKILEHGTGVVYLGFPECPWCQAYVKYLNEVAKEVGIDKIYYYNIPVIQPAYELYYLYNYNTELYYFIHPSDLIQYRDYLAYLLK